MSKRGGALRDVIGRVLRSPRDPGEAAAQVLGDVLAERLVRAFRRTRIRDAAREGTEQLEQARPRTDPVVRRGLALALMIAEATSLKYRRASGRALYRGRTARQTPTGAQYVPSVSAGGLAARLSCSPRELDRYLAVLNTHGILAIHQRPPTRAESERGLEWGYAVYQWLCALPRQLAARLRSLQRRSAPAVAPERVPLTDDGRALADALLGAAPS